MQDCRRRLRISIHTPTQGVTLRHRPRRTTSSNFNPHSHAGSDDYLDRDILLLKHISIHTPTQGVTKLSISIRVSYEISIHTPTQGVTESVSILQNMLAISIHTPTQGVTITQARNHFFDIFQSTLPRRE